MASSKDRIAIVGMACRFPGGAHSPEALWSLLENGKCTMEEIPRSRFDVNEYWSKDGNQVNRMMARQGHFIQEGELFDEKFFNLSPREALNTDASISPRWPPQHRLLLECVVDALDDAGYKPHDTGGEQGWKKSRMGVFVGSATDSYQNNLADHIDAFFCPGTIRGFASGRISHYFGFQGPSIVYDTACSSGLVSVHAACQSLILNECDSAIASGTNMLTSPEMFIGLSKGFFISNTGGCRTFDETADGYCRAEGVGVLVLKRLQDAIRDNDKIDAIIVASGTNQSGPAESLTTPHAPTQSMLFQSNCMRAGIPPGAICAVEAHGTGTQAGDYAEMEAIKSAYCVARPPGDKDSVLFVSSLKPNIGHSESTSGIASVIKAVLMMKHRTIPPHIGITTKLNPRLGDLAAHGIVIPTAKQALHPVSGYANIFVSVNNFGAPGGNANIILQDATSLEKAVEGADNRTYHVVTLSAQPHTPFQSVISQFARRLEDLENNDLPSLSYTTTVRRVDYPMRLAFSASTIEELKGQLRRTAAPQSMDSKYDTRIGFVIGGNGSQFQGMAKMLYETCSAFRLELQKCDAIFRNRGGPGFLGVITGDVDPFDPQYDNFLCTSMSIFAVGYAMGMMWKEWGVNPSAIVGHSLGEFAAFALAGCLSVEDAVQLIVWRTQAIYAEDASSSGGMIVVGLGEADARELLENSGCEGLAISCYNGPSQTCFSGGNDELAKLLAFAQTLPRVPLIKMLQSKIPWHSSGLKSAADRFFQLYRDVIFRPAQVPIILNTSGMVLQPGQVPSQPYLAEQMLQPVRFDLCIGNALAQSVDVWVELSAKTLLLPLLKSQVSSRVGLLPTLGSPETDCWRTVSKALVHLYERHVNINWTAYHKPYRPQLIALPSYPFTRNRHWADYRDRLHLTENTSQGFQRNHEIISTPVGPLEVEEPWKKYKLRTHSVNFHPGVFIWLALSCTVAANIVQDFEIIKSMPRGKYVSILVGTPTSAAQTVSFVHHNDEDTLQDGVLIASCKVKSGSFNVPPGVERIFQRSRSRLMSNKTSSFLNQALVSKLLVSSMGPFRSDRIMENLAVSDDGEEAVGEIKWDEKQLDSKHEHLSPVALNPSELLSLLQPASLTMFLGSSASCRNISYYIDHLDFAPGFLDKCPAINSLRVHVLIEASSDDSSLGDVMSSQSHVFSETGSLLARVVGFREAGTQDGGEPRMSLSLKFPAEEPADSVAPMLSPNSILILSPSSTVQEDIIPSPIKPVGKTLTNAMITDVLSQELGVPAHSILGKDKLEDLGVDSIMSLLLRDKLRQLSGRPLGWFRWKRGLSVQDLWNHVLQA